MVRTSAQVLNLFEFHNVFPVLQPDKKEEYIPYNVIAPHEAQAMKNHGQTLQRLAERGGLCWSEMLAVLKDKTWKELGWGPNGPGEDAAKKCVMDYITTRVSPKGCGTNLVLEEVDG